MGKTFLCDTGRETPSHLTDCQTLDTTQSRLILLSSVTGRQRHVTHWTSTISSNVSLWCWQRRSFRQVSCIRPKSSGYS